MNSTSRPVFLRGFRSWLNYRGIHPVDAALAVACFILFTISLAWPRPQFRPTQGPCRTVIYHKPTSATAYFGTFNEAGECVILRKENRG